MERCRERLKRVLIVEDEPLIAAIIARTVTVFDEQEVYRARSNTDANTILIQSDVTFAILDVGLSDGTCDPIAKRLIDLSIPFIFVSGFRCSEVTRFGANIPFVQKPFTITCIEKAVTEALNPCLTYAA